VQHHPDPQAHAAGEEDVGQPLGRDVAQGVVDTVAMSCEHCSTRLGEAFMAGQPPKDGHPMGQLVYTGIGSLDGFTADAHGEFDWSAPSEEVHSFINERDRAVAAELYGRRLYEVVRAWETFGTGPDATPVEREYGKIWRNRDKVVFSTALPSVSTARPRLERSFDPRAVRRFVDEVDGDVNIGGANLAAQALRAGIIDRDEYYLNQ